MLGLQNQVRIVFNGSYSFPGSVKTFRVCQRDAVVLSAVGGEDADVCVTPAATPGGCPTSVEYTHEPVITWQEFGRDLGFVDPSDPRSFIVDTSISNGDEAPEPLAVSAQEPENDGCRSKAGEESSEASAFLLIHNSCSGWAGEEDMEELLSQVDQADYERIPQGTAECRPGDPWGPITVHDVSCSYITVKCTGEAFIYEIHERKSDGVTSTVFGKCIYKNGNNAAYRKGGTSFCGNQKTEVVAHVVFDPNPCQNNSYKHRLRIRNLVRGEPPIDRFVYYGRYCPAPHGPTCRRICPTTNIRTLLSSRNTMPESEGEVECYRPLDPVCFPPPELPS